MLTQLDDYPVHQTPEPVAHPASSDRNHYDRYFFNGHAPDGSLYFGAAMGLYPNRRVLDASLSVVRGGRQHSLHASRLAPLERTETRCGPIAVEVVEPMRTLRLRADSNPHGIACDLVFRARGPALEEARATRRFEGRVFMDSTRFTQFGRWEGWIEATGERIAVAVPGCRDRSWGIRPVGEPAGGVPAVPQVHWIWSTLQFEDVCTLSGRFEDETGRPWHSHGALLRDGGQPEDMASIAHRIRWRPGTRRAASAEVELVPHAGEPIRIALEPILTFQMLGLGYLNPEWGHGVWKGPEALGAESWTVAELNPLDPRHVHVQQLCRARWGAREGFGLLEQLVIGPHAPSGLTGIFDGAAG
jgi:hypothetical protein